MVTFVVGYEESAPLIALLQSYLVKSYYSISYDESYFFSVTVTTDGFSGIKISDGSKIP